MGQNFPNPFRSETWIPFQMQPDGDIDISIYNLLGQKVRQLVSEKRAAGMHRIQGEGRDDQGFLMVGEAYFVR